MASVRSAHLKRRPADGKSATKYNAFARQTSRGRSTISSARNRQQFRRKTTNRDDEEPDVGVVEVTEPKIIDKYDLVKATLDKCTVDIVESMQPQNLFRRFREKKMFKFAVVRDAQELPNTSEKNRRIQDMVYRNPLVYKQFKVCLAETGQSPLVEILQICEIQLHDEMKAAGYQCCCINTDNCSKLVEVRCSLAKYTRATLALPHEEDTILQLQGNLINIYEEFCQQIPVFPLKPQDTYNIETLYVQPSLHIVDHSGRKKHSFTNSFSDVTKANSAEHNKSSLVDSYRQIFYSKEAPCRNIYIVAEAGLGKSTLCERFVNTWCRAHTAKLRRGAEQFSEDEQVMAEFPLLFYISLSAASEENDIEEMIKKQQLSSSDISKFLEKEKCLIILDGLDEWKPKHYRGTRFITKGLPVMNLNMEKTTIVTTTRPWKLEALRLKENEIDKHINITGLNKKAIEGLAEKVMTVLRGNDKKENKTAEKLVSEFTKQIEESSLQHFMQAPVLLMQLLCLWFDGIPFGNSQCEIYGNMIDRQLKLAEVTEKVPRFEDNSKTEIITLPVCLTKNKHCDKYDWLLQSLSKLAYHTIMNIDRENALVFDHEETQNRNMSPADVELCFRIGLLTQNLYFGTITQNLKIIGFIHKTHHEYLAAVLLSSCVESERFEQVFEVITSLEMVLEMEKMVVFVSGMNPTCGRKLLQRFVEHLGKVNNVSAYRLSCLEPEIEPAYYMIKQMQKTIIACANEAELNKHQDISLPLGDMVFVEDTFTSIIGSLHTINPEALISVCISTDSDRYQERKEDYENVVKHVSRSKHLKKFFLDGRYDVLDIERTFSVVSVNRSTLQSVVLSNVNLSNLDDKFESMLYSPNLMSLGLANTSLTTVQLEALTNFLSETKQLCELYLSMLMCGGNKPSGYTLDLTGQKGLQKLHLRDLYVEEVRLEANRLTKCEIGYLHTPGITKAILNILKEEGKIRVFECSGCNSQADIDALANCIRSFFSLHEIMLQNIDFGKRVPRLSSNAEHLKSVKLVNVELEETSLKNMVTSLPSEEVFISLERLKIISDDKNSDDNIVEYIKANRADLYVTWTQCKVYGSNKRWRLIADKMDIL